MRRQASGWGRGLLLGVATALLTATLVVGYASVASARDSGDRIVLLGSGNALSVLVTSDSTRLLLATGPNRTDFGNAINSALPFAARRIDVLLVAGRGAGLVVPARAVDQFDPQLVAAVHPLDATDVARNFSGQPPRLFDGPVRIRLGQRVRVTVETAGGASGDDDPVWRIVVERDRTRVAVLSSAGAYDAFSWSEPIAAVVVVDGSIESVEGIRAGAIAGPAARMDSTVLAVGSETPGVRYAIEVRPEAAVEMRFVDDGLRLPSSAEALAETSPDTAV